MPVGPFGAASTVVWVGCSLVDLTYGTLAGPTNCTKHSIATTQLPKCIKLLSIERMRCVKATTSRL